MSVFVTEYQQAIRAHLPHSTPYGNIALTFAAMDTSVRSWGVEHSSWPGRATLTKYQGRQRMVKVDKDIS